MEIGRADGFLAQQFFVSANLFTLPLWVAGLHSYLISAAGRRYRALGLDVRRATRPVPPGARTILLHGARLPDALRGGHGGLGRMARPPKTGHRASRSYWHLGRTRSRHDLQHGHHYADRAEQFGGLPPNEQGARQFYRVDRLAGIGRDGRGHLPALPDAEKPHAAILAGNYGEAGAINLYGGAYHLPEVICGTNSYWWRGYGAEQPEVVILVGFSRESAERFTDQVELAGHVTNRYGVRNEETKDHPDIFVCRKFKKSWPEFWKGFQRFG
jgi:hypothetical protein